MNFKVRVELRGDDEVEKEKLETVNAVLAEISKALKL